MDSGAEVNYIRKSTAVNKLDLPLEYLPNTTVVVFGNGSEAPINSAAHLSPSIPAVVLPDETLVEDLISPNPIVDLGYRIVLEKDEGWIERDNERVITLRREQLKWLVNLQDLKCLNAKIVKKEATPDSTVKDKVILLHRRMGHPSTKIMKAAVKAGAWVGCGVTARDIELVMEANPCPVCIMGKHNKIKIHNSITDPRSVPIANLISGDIIGPITPTAKDGSKYFFLFVDRRTSYYHVSTSKSKDGFITALKHCYDWYKSQGHTIRAFRSDSENIMVSGGVEEYLKSQVVEQQFSLPYAHWQNLVERHVQTVVNMTTTVLHDQMLLGWSFWDYCLFYVIVLLNNTPNSKTDGRTPKHAVTGVKAADLKREFLFPFGQPVAARIPKRTWRFDLKSELGIYLGVSEGSVGGGLVYYPSSRAITARADLVPLDIAPEDFRRYENCNEGSKPHIDELIFEIPQLLSSIEEERKEDEELYVPIPGQSTIPEKEQVAPPTTGHKAQDGLKVPASRKQVKALLRKLGMKTRSISKLSALLANTTRAGINRKSKGDELSEALASEDGQHWIEALLVELESLLNVTRSIVPEMPESGTDYDMIYATTALKKKLHADGSVDKFKVRIPVCGNQLKSKWDYNNDTYSPTVSMLTHTALLQLSIHDKMCMATFDTVAAYLHQLYPEDLKPLYLKFPKRLAEACGIDPQQLYRVKKYLYGLPDAGRAYYLAYSKVLTENGYSKCISDPCLFTRFDDTIGLRTYCWIHVDDTFVSSTHPSELTRFQAVIGAAFPITANFDVDSHLGISLKRNPDGSLTLLQPKLLQQLFDEWPSSSRKSKYPASVRSNNDEKLTTSEVEQSTYLRLLGQLNYLANSRPDILTAVSYAATRSKQPTQLDYEDLLSIVSYLRQTPEYGLTLFPKKGDEDDGKVHLTAFADAAYMSHIDASSHTGYCIAIGSMHPRSFVINKSSKQKCIATSSTHAEVRALFDLTVNLVYLITLFTELKRPIELPVTVFEDNQSTIDLVTSSTTRIGKSKHYLMLIQYIREQVTTGLIEVNKVAGEENISNILTKIITSAEYFDSINRIMGIGASSNE
jgi:hypothetical protein